MKPKILFIGGTGVISSACSELLMELGYDLYLLNRGISERPAAAGSKTIKADIRNVKQVSSLIEKKTFDVVVDWIAYTPDHVINDYNLFSSKTAQYIFISSASAYQKPPHRLPITETEPLINPIWTYSQGKIACEEKLMELFRTHRFPVTIVRPSHTYDRRKVPLYGGYTAIDRILKEKEIIIHGDGTSLWTLTHHKDFALGFVGLLGREAAIGMAYHITSDEVLTWNQICAIIGNALGKEPKVIHIPSDFIAKFDREWGDSLLGDKAHSMFFDNTRIKKINPVFRAKIPFQEGAREIVSWYSGDESRKEVNVLLSGKMDEIISRYKSAFK